MDREESIEKVIYKFAKGDKNYEAWLTTDAGAIYVKLGVIDYEKKIDEKEARRLEQMILSKDQENKLVAEEIINNLYHEKVE